MFKILKYNNDYITKTNSTDIFTQTNISLFQNDSCHSGQILEIYDKLYIVTTDFPKHWQYNLIYALDILDVFETDYLHEIDGFYRKEVPDGYRYIRIHNSKYMTVKDLKEKLNQFSDNLVVMMPNPDRNSSPHSVWSVPVKNVAQGCNEEDGYLFIEN